MKKTKIDWADSTWNPVTGCLHGCEYCYARGIANRFGSAVTEKYNADLKHPMKKENGKIDPYPHGFNPTFHRYRLDIPQKWKEPKNIFVCSMADLFGDWVPDEWIKEVFAACEAAPQHRYLFLTKNPERYHELSKSKTLKHGFWYGATVTKPTEFSGCEKHSVTMPAQKNRGTDTGQMTIIVTLIIDGSPVSTCHARQPGYSCERIRRE